MLRLKITTSIKSIFSIFICFLIKYSNENINNNFLVNNNKICATTLDLRSTRILSDDIPKNKNKFYLKDRTDLNDTSILESFSSKDEGSFNEYKLNLSKNDRLYPFDPPYDSKISQITNLHLAANYHSNSRILKTSDTSSSKSSMTNSFELEIDYVK